jgi:K+/H+ antiporter YhaU regulatory subunit KhtT
METIKKRMDGVVVNLDDRSRQQYLEQRKLQEKEAARVSALESKINNIDSELSQIKQLLTQLVKASNG